MFTGLRENCYIVWSHLHDIREGGDCWACSGGITLRVCITVWGYHSVWGYPLSAQKVCQMMLQEAKLRGSCTRQRGCDLLEEHMNKQVMVGFRNGRFTERGVRFLPGLYVAKFAIVANAGFRDAHPALNANPNYVYTVTFVSDASLEDVYLDVNCVAQSIPSAIAQYLEGDLGVRGLAYGSTAAANLSLHIQHNRNHAESVASRFSVDLKEFWASRLIVTNANGDVFHGHQGYEGLDGRDEQITDRRVRRYVESAPADVVTLQFASIPSLKARCNLHGSQWNQLQQNGHIGPAGNHTWTLTKTDILDEVFLRRPWQDGLTCGACDEHM